MLVRAHSHSVAFHFVALEQIDVALSLHKPANTEIALVLLMHGAYMSFSSSCHMQPSRKADKCPMAMSISHRWPYLMTNTYAWTTVHLCPGRCDPTIVHRNASKFHQVRTLTHQVPTWGSVAGQPK